MPKGEAGGPKAPTYFCMVLGMLIKKNIALQYQYQLIFNIEFSQFDWRFRSLGNFCLMHFICISSSVCHNAKRTMFVKNTCHIISDFKEFEFFNDVWDERFFNVSDDLTGDEYCCQLLQEKWRNDRYTDWYKAVNLGCMSDSISWFRSYSTRRYWSCRGYGPGGVTGAWEVMGGEKVGEYLDYNSLISR